MKHLIFLLSLLVLSSCADDMESPGALVPPTADEDPSLPQLTVTVDNHTRVLHLQTFGNPDDPPIFVLHGGPGGRFQVIITS